jgi:lipid-A-disaccharide synthase
MLVILPFEEEFYREAGVEVEYVGHPLVEEVKITASREEFSTKHNLNSEKPMIALLPGSRRKEIHYHLPAMLDAAARLMRMNFQLPAQEIVSADSRSNLKSHISDVQFILPLASTVDHHQVETILEQSRFTNEINLTLIERDTYNAVGHSLFAVVASGTATVETALAGTPMIIIYQASTLNHAIMRPLIEIETFGMVNLIAGRRIVPELIQFDVTGERIANEMAAILSDPSRYWKMKEDIASVRARLESAGGPGADRAAHAVMDVAMNSCQ